MRYSPGSAITRAGARRLRSPPPEVHHGTTRTLPSATTSRGTAAGSRDRPGSGCACLRDSLRAPGDATNVACHPEADGEDGEEAGGLRARHKGLVIVDPHRHGAPHDVP